MAWIDELPLCCTSSNSDGGNRPARRDSKAALTSRCTFPNGTEPDCCRS
jgi:hypothetical protein